MIKHSFDEVFSIHDKGDEWVRAEIAQELYKALESTNLELNMAIEALNELKRQNICCTDLDPPEYHDQQTVHENMVLLAKAGGES